MTKEEIVKLGKRYFQENPDEMVSLYRQIYGETISCITCKDTIGQAFDYIKRNMDKPICKYKIKPEYRKISNADGHWTNFNMTDEVAERLILQGYKDYFTW